MSAGLLRSLGLLAVAGAVPAPEVPAQYSAVVLMRMPYIPLEMSLRVLTSSSAQKVEYYNGLQVDVSGAEGTFKYSFNNSRRVCTYTAPAAGPTENGLKNETWAPKPFLPELSQYNYSGEELVGGIMCQKWTLSARHGALGTMDDHISFYWDAVLGKPVRWHVHARSPTFGSHTDEYIFDYLSFQAQAPAQADLALPKECKEPKKGRSAATFLSFLKQQGKAYGAGEQARRQALFERNTRLVKELNEQHAGRTTFRGNQFLDMTAREVLGMRGGKNRGPSRSRRAPEHWQFVETYAEGADLEEPPTDFDWRVAKPGSVAAVKDQAMCGSCWAYGAMGPVESIQALRTGQLVELPEQFVVDCTWTNSTGDSGSNSGCDGGDSDIGALEIVRKFGGVVPTARSYGAYLSVNGYCKDTRLMEVGAKILSWVDVPKRNERLLMAALFREGPLNVNIQVPDEMLFYDSGVLNVQSCKNDEDQIDHAVVATGFGTDAHGTPFYVVRNSWSTYWGDEGYFKVARGQNDCCIACQPGYPRLAKASDLLI